MCTPLPRYDRCVLVVRVEAISNATVDYNYHLHAWASPIDYCLKRHGQTAERAANDLGKSEALRSQTWHASGRKSGW